MDGHIATVIGATGLIGGHLLDLLKEDTYYTTVRALVRRPVSFNHPKVESKLISFEDHESYKIGIDGSDAVFCAIGTTQKKVKGDKAAYRKVDYDIPVKAARFCKETGVNHFSLVSSVGANSKSRNFYLMLKGEVEDAVRSYDLPSVAIFRPSMLLGNRDESRPAEKVGQVVMGAVSFLIPGNYKPVESRDVARAMIEASKKREAGFHIHHYKEIKERNY